MHTLISFVSLILSVYSAPRYVIDYYTIPNLDTFADDPQPSPFPFDVCLNYKIAFAGFTVSYGKYTCSQDGNSVTFTDYGTDATCSTAVNTNDKTITYDAGLGVGEVGTFNCDGEDDYVQVAAYTVSGEQTQTNGEAICCGNAAGYTQLLQATTTFAVGVCVSLPDDQVYTSGECTSKGSSVDIYLDSACTQATGASTDASSLLCGNFGASSIASVFRMQTDCVLNGVSYTPENDYCPYVSSYPSQSPTTAAPTTPSPTGSPTTAEPTKNPTTAEPTDGPTEMPSMSPTETTNDPSKAPSGSPTTAAPTEQEASNTGYMNIVNYIVLLIMGMAIFVN